MDPSYGFGAKSAAGLSRPPRLAKLRKPLTGQRPNSARPISQDSGFEQNAGGGFVFGGSSSVSGNSSLVNDSVFSDLERSKVADDLMRLNIGSEKERINRNVSGGSGGNVHPGGGLRGVDESMVSELPDEMRRLFIESEYLSKGYGENVEGDLPNKMKKLNVKGEEDDELRKFRFGGNVDESLSGSLDTVLQNKIKDLKIEESFSTSQREKVNANDTNKFAFGKNGNDSELTSEDVASSVQNTSNNNKSGEETLQGTTSDNLGAGNLYNGPGLHTAGFAFQAGLQRNNGGRDVSYGSENTPMSTSSHPRSVANAGKKVEFSFTSKLDTMGGQNVEFKTPDPKGHFAFSFNRRGESTKDTTSKKKKGKWKKPAQVPLSFGQGFGFQDTSNKYSDSPEQYSPMDVSPYEEIPADNMFSRETSVASEESFHMDDNISSTEEQPNSSNDIVDEHLASVTGRLYINESDVRHSDVQDEESSYCVNGGTGVESNEEGAFSGVETESFKSATDELEYSCDSFITATDAEVSSSSSLERQDSDGTSQYKYDAGLPDLGQTSFVFAASSPNISEPPAPVISQKKKYRIRVGQESYSSGLNSKSSPIASGLPPFPVAGSSLLSPDHGQKSNLSSPLRHGRGNIEQVAELETKLDSATVASIAAQESCEKWRLRGNQAYAKGEFTRAEDYYTQGINCISESEASRSCLRALLLCYSNRAATRKSSGRVKEALQDCLKAAALDPSFLRVQVRAGSCYLALGDVENASLHYVKCLQAGPEACADRKILVEASEGLEKTQKVAECMKQAAGLLERKTPHDIDFANSLITEALTISSCSEKLLQMKVDVLLMLKKYEDIIQLCEQLLPMESNFLTSGVGHSLEYHGSDLKRAPSFRVWCCSLILKSYFYLGRLEQALVFVKKQEESWSLMERNERKNLESMIPLVSTIRELLRHKAAGNEAYQGGNHVEAVEHYSASISCSVESRPFAAICFCNRAAAYRAMGQIVDALADCSLAIALDGNYFKAITRRAALYEMIRDYGQAVTDIQKLISLLTKELDKKGSHSAPSDKLSCINELRQARLKLSEMEEADRKEIPLNMYLILGIDPSAAPSEIRKAYRKAALKYHPDKAGQSLARNENSDDGIWKEIAAEVHKDAERLFKMIGEAYAILSDPAKRSRYDLEEELRNSPNRGHGVGASKMHQDFHSYSFGREGPRRQWQDVRRTYEDLRRGPERAWYS